MLRECGAMGRWSALFLLPFGLIAGTDLGAQEPVVVSEQLQAKVKAAIERARGGTLASQMATGSGQGSLTAYALLKAGQPLDTPLIQTQLRLVKERIDAGGYDPGRDPPHHVYEAACDAMLLADTDPEGNKERLERLRDYLVRKQLPNGAWYYPNIPVSVAVSELGDTSITQFAILGLWAVQRAQVDVSRETLAKTGKWLIKSQRSDDGFAYHPFEPSPPHERLTSESMTAAGCGTLAVIRLLLYGEGAPIPSASATPTSRKKFGVLEQAAGEGEKPDKPAARTGTAVTVSREALDKGIRSSQEALGKIFNGGTKGRFPVYFLYTCERTGTLLATERFGSHRWYEAGVEFLLEKQSPTGEWSDFGGGPVPGPANTAFAMLFLSRATRTLVKPIPRLVGGGLLAGGRGLPDELDRVDVQNGAVKQRMKKGPVDDLLGQLEQPQEISLPTIQKAIVESVSLDNPDELIGQLDRLQKLARHPEVEVRQVAVWAIGRSGDYRMTPVLIERLTDADRVVAWEANLALCVISRMPLGIPPVNGKQPLPIAPPEVIDGDPNSQARYKQWHDQTQAAWDAWYLRVRPYDERDDRRQLPRK